MKKYLKPRHLHRVLEPEAVAAGVDQTLVWDCVPVVAPALRVVAAGAAAGSHHRG